MEHLFTSTFLCVWCGVVLCMFIYLILFFIFSCVKSLHSRENSAKTRSRKQLFAMTKSTRNRFEFYFRLLSDDKHQTHFLGHFISMNGFGFVSFHFISSTFGMQ